MIPSKIILHLIMHAYNYVIEIRPKQNATKIETQIFWDESPNPPFTPGI